MWRRTPLAFSVGYLSHLGGDAWRALLQGDLYGVRWLAWPLFRMPPVAADDVPPLTCLVRIWGEMEHHPDLAWILLGVGVFGGVRLLGWLRERRELGRDSDADAPRSGNYWRTSVAYA